MKRIKRLCLATCCCLASTSSVALGEVAVVMPDWMNLPNETLPAFADRFGETRTYSGHFNAWRGDDALLAYITQGAMRDEPEVIIFLGFGHESLSARSETIEDVLENGWNEWSTGERIDVPGDPLHRSGAFDQTTDAIPLGLGFADPRTNKKERIVYFPMGWNVSLPVVSAAVYTRGGTDPNEVAEWLYNSEEGNALRAGLAVLPFDGGGGGPEITMKPWVDIFEDRYASDEDDDCGCDESKTCDPDTNSSFLGPAVNFFEIEPANGRGVVSVPRNAREDDTDDDCGCEAQALWLEDMATLRAHAAASGRNYGMLNAMQSGKQIVVFSCDPD